MKLFKFSTNIAIAISLAFFMISCNSGGEKKADVPAVDTTAIKSPEPAPVPAAKPANVTIIMHKVANFDKWKALYESHDSARLAYGLHNYVVARGIKDPNMVLVALKMDDAAKAKEFFALPDLKERMKTGGVLGAPSFNFLDVQMLDTSTNPQTTRVILTHKVKDWDAWKKEFDSHKQVRMDAGLTDRSVGYSIGDNHTVSVVCAVSDLKKAEAFFQSKDLKDKMMAAGVEGAPSIFFYNVAQKY